MCGQLRRARDVFGKLSRFVVGKKYTSSVAKNIEPIET